MNLCPLDDATVRFSIHAPRPRKPTFVVYTHGRRSDCVHISRPVRGPRTHYSRDNLLVSILVLLSIHHMYFHNFRATPFYLTFDIYFGTCTNLGRDYMF